MKVKKLESIIVTKAPSKITYTEGQNFDKTGMEITATYNDKSTKKVYSSLKARQGPLFNLKTYAKRVILSRYWHTFLKIKSQIGNRLQCPYGLQHSQPTLL